MPKFILENVRLFTGGADLAGQSNKVELAAEVEDKDTTKLRLRGREGSPRRARFGHRLRRGPVGGRSPGPRR